MDKKKMPDFMRMFQGRDLDLSQFSRSCEIYTQNTKTVADTIRDNRIDIFLPWKPVLLDGLAVMHEIKTVTAAGADLEEDKNQEVAEALLFSGLSSACDQIESIQFLHGNGAGEIIYEISSNAFAYLQAMFQGCKDPSKYGLYIDTKTEQYTVTGAGAYANEAAIIAGLTLAKNTEYTGMISNKSDFKGAYTVEKQQLLKIQ